MPPRDSAFRSSCWGWPEPSSAGGDQKKMVFFLAPCLWLLAVEGLRSLAQRLPPAAAFAVPLLVLGLTVPGLIKTVKLCAWVKPKMEYREALVFVQGHRCEGDAVWNWCPELSAAYSDHVFCWPRTSRIDDPHDVYEATRSVNSGPLWVIAPDTAVEDMVRPLRSLPVRETLRRQFLGVKVLRFDY
jgi:hypothetical protein